MSLLDFIWPCFEIKWYFKPGHLLLSLMCYECKPLRLPGNHLRFVCHQQTALLKRLISHLATKTFLRHSRTRFKSTSSSLVRTSTLVIHCNGGLVASQFPNLSCFARDILSIPGEFTN